MTILVTGATGNVGRQVVAQLVRAGQPVRAMTRRPQTSRLPDSAEVVQGDFERPDTWPAALDGVQSVYLFPFVYAAPDHGFVDEAVKAGVTRFVVHSAAAAGFPAGTGGDGALGRHLTEEREAHRGLELLVEASGAEWTHVRPGLLAANALQWADQIRAGRVVRGPYASAGYPVVHEADVADVAVAALLTDDHVGAAYTVTGPVKVSQAEQVTAIGAAIGVQVRFEELDPAEARRQWLRDGFDEETVDWMIALLADAIDGTGALPPTDTYLRVTERPPRTFARWANDHAADFRPEVTR
ncbi:NAD(P)H-binding protein [Micromonospora sp. NBC_00362]|uniref:NAD(P)H-binding protein n=1 Tax=Micromonospora sp. NBC_00362 TaxID=2975975 RepID=UPI00224DF0E9|nr:NAD(P)H-binding protein [Micromonospora sp. NBC_00362]MCX5115798.1 NAD(P)H-binding protein [Micromonospora sp. NBC_00362]